MYLYLVVCDCEKCGTYFGEEVYDVELCEPYAVCPACREKMK